MIYYLLVLLAVAVIGVILSCGGRGGILSEEGGKACPVGGLGLDPGLVFVELSPHDDGDMMWMMWRWYLSYGDDKWCILKVKT